jgi:hypothetical protein
MMEAQKLTNIWQPFNGEYNVKVLCAVGDFENGTFSLPPKLNSSTNAQLTTIAPIAQNTCYAFGLI